MNLGQYSWKCPRSDCKYDTIAYTEGGMRRFQQEHLDQHAREDRAAGRMSTTMVLYRPPINYDILRVTSADIAFLRTRGVKLDDKIELDKSIIPQSTNNELSQKKWAVILERAWKTQ